MLTCLFSACDQWSIGAGRFLEMMAAELICAQLRALGTQVVFGLMGGGNLTWVPRLADVEIRYVGASHEAAAVAMADAYARVTGSAGVCTVTHGPGLTNSTTALIEAVKSHTPLVIITGEIPNADRHHNQYLDQAALMRAIDCPWISVRSPATLATDLCAAFRIAASQQRPVAVGVPIEFQQAEVEEKPIFPLAAAPSRVAPGWAELARVLELLRGSERIVMIGGRGAVRAGAGAAIRELAARCGALVGTTAMGFGLFADDPYSIGICGGFASERVARLVHAADLIVAFGASLHPWTTRAGDLIGPEATVVQVDSDPASIGVFNRVDVGVVGDARLVAERLHDELRRAGFQASRSRTTAIASVIGTDRGEPFEDESTATVIDPRSLMVELERLLPSRRTLVMDSGSFMIFPSTMLSATDAESFVFTQAFMVLGLGLASGVGAAIGRPDQLTVVVIGDGGLQMSLGELVSVARAACPMLIVVMNDRAYGAEVHDLRALGLPEELALLPETDFAAIASDIGLAGMTVRSVADCSQLAEWLAAPTGAMLVDCKVNGDVQGPWHEL